MSVNAPQGFVAVGGYAGIKAAKAHDVAVVATADGRAVPAAGVFTSNLAAAAPVQVDATYRTPIQHHNPIELFGTTCVWEGDRLTVYEATRYLDGVQHGLAAQLGMNEGAVKVAVHRLRKRYRQLLRAEIAQTLAATEDVDEELRHLFSVLAGR